MVLVAYVCLRSAYGHWVLVPLLGGTQVLVPIPVLSPRVILKHLVHGGQREKAVKNQPSFLRIKVMSSIWGRALGGRDRHDILYPCLK